MGERHGIRRFWNAGRYSWQGLKACYMSEEAFRQELTLVAVLAPLALWLGETPWQRAMLLTGLLAVLVVELLNSAIEAVVDRIGSERNPLSGRAKDMGSAAVALTLAGNALLWGALLWQRLAD